MMFILHMSKMHWTDKKPQIIKITSSDYTPGGAEAAEVNANSNSSFCPFLILNQYLQVWKNGRKQDEEKFFVFKDRSPVTPVQFRTKLKELIANIGLNPDMYDTRSFRSGREVDLLDLGLTLESVKKIGRWRSNAVYTYLRQ